MSSSPSDPTPVLPVPVSRPAPPPYVSTLGPKLRALLFCSFAGVALLGATGAYLIVISWLNWYDPERLYTTPYWFWMLILHCGVGLLFVLPFVIFGTTHLVTARTRPNRLAVRLGIVLFTLGLIVTGSGLALFRLEGLP